MDGFDLDSPLVCEGIIGDGCGGGRIFFIEDETLQVYDPMTKERMVLLESIVGAKELYKKACIISVLCQERVITFDLSALKQV
jgi:hypothetical protein